MNSKLGKRCSMLINSLLYGKVQQKLWWSSSRVLNRGPRILTRGPRMQDLLMVINLSEARFSDLLIIETKFRNRLHARNDIRQAQSKTKPNIKDLSNEDKNKRCVWVNKTDCDIKLFDISLTFLCLLFVFSSFVVFSFLLSFNKESSNQPYRLKAIMFYLISTLYTVLHSVLTGDKSRYIQFYLNLYQIYLWNLRYVVKQSLLMWKIIVTKLHNCSPYKRNVDRKFYCWEAGHSCWESIEGSHKL